MIDWALRQDVHCSINAYVDDNSELAADALSKADWALLAKVRNFLQRFHEITIKMQKRSDTLATLLPSMD